jgi:hypothetical protein
MLWFLTAYGIFDLMGVGTAISTKNKSVEDIVAILANRTNEEFIKELSRVLSRSQSTVGYVDLLQRLPDGRLRLAGWAVDKGETGEPVSIFVIVPTKVVLMATTHNRREEVALAIGVPKDSKTGFDDVFDYQFNCKDNERNPFVLAINHKKQFSVINAGMRVSGC